jgi:hypothetical protein
LAKISSTELHADSIANIASVVSNKQFLLIVQAVMKYALGIE